VPGETHRTLIPLFDELRGGRVLVRPYHADDAEPLFEAIVESIDSIRPWMPWWQQYHSVDDARDFIARCTAWWQLREDLITSLWDIETGRYLGGSGLHPRDWDAGVFEIGYWLRTSAVGKGYMTEAVRLQTDFAFDYLHANRVFIRCDARNRRSAAAAERLGFVREGLFRNDALDVNGKPRDTLVFALMPADPRWPHLAKG
jgi:ribosomal-protein-serine acetyltransferase